MTSAEILRTSGKSKSQRSYVKAGSLFFLLLHMFNGTASTDTTTAIPESTTTSQSQTVTNPATSSLSTATGQMTSLPSATPTSQSQTVTSNPATSSLSTAIGQATSVATDLKLVSSSNITNNITLPTNLSTDSMNTSSLAGNGTMLSCPEFTCTNDCYAKFTNKTANPCPPAASFCELSRQNGSYSVQCSVRCAMSCGNPPVTNCSLGCCNTTDCLNYALLNMSNSFSTAAPTKSMITPTTTKATVPSTPANNGKKCQSIKCDGAACYKTNNALGVVFCPNGQDYCMLNKTMSGTTESWLGGCSTDCRKAQACSTTVTTCYLECCNATASASCLKLTGDLNMPSSATRGPQSTLLLTASLVMLWMMKILT